MVTNSVSFQGVQHVSNETPALATNNVSCIGNNNVINIQLSYDSDQLIEPKL